VKHGRDEKLSSETVPICLGVIVVLAAAGTVTIGLRIDCIDVKGGTQGATSGTTWQIETWRCRQWNTLAFPLTHTRHTVGIISFYRDTVKIANDTNTLQIQVRLGRKGTRVTRVDGFSTVCDKTMRYSRLTVPTPTGTTVNLHWAFVLCGRTAQNVTLFRNWRSQ